MLNFFSTFFSKFFINSQFFPYAQFTSSAKVHETNSELEHVHAQSTDFRKTSDLMKQIEKVSEPY